MSSEKYEFGIIMKVEVKVTKRNRQRFSSSLGDKDTFLHMYRYTNEHTESIYTADLSDIFNRRKIKSGPLSSYS